MADESAGVSLRLAIAVAKAVARAGQSKTSPAADVAGEFTARRKQGGLKSPAKGADEARTARLSSTAAPTAFVSWAHTHASWDDEQERDWQSQVANFTLTLRTLGIDAELDLFHVDDADVDWTRFGPKGVREAGHVLIVMSRAWAERWQGDNASHEGAGAVAEADELRGLFGRNQAEFQRKCSIIQFPDVPTRVIPDGLSRLLRYRVDVEDPDSYTSLIRALTGQPRFPKPPVGQLPVLPPEILGHKVTDNEEAIEQLRVRLRATDDGSSRGATYNDAMRSSLLRGLIESLMQEPFDD